MMELIQDSILVFTKVDLLALGVWKDRRPPGRGCAELEQHDYPAGHIAHLLSAEAARVGSVFPRSTVKRPVQFNRRFHALHNHLDDQAVKDRTPVYSFVDSSGAEVSISKAYSAWEAWIQESNWCRHRLLEGSLPYFGIASLHARLNGIWMQSLLREGGWFDSREAWVAHAVELATSRAEVLEPVGPASASADVVRAAATLLDGLMTSHDALTLQEAVGRLCVEALNATSDSADSIGALSSKLCAHVCGWFGEKWAAKLVPLDAPGKKARDVGARLTSEEVAVLLGSDTGGRRGAGVGGGGSAGAADSVSGRGAASGAGVGAGGASGGAGGGVPRSVAARPGPAGAAPPPVPATSGAGRDVYRFPFLRPLILTLIRMWIKTGGLARDSRVDFRTCWVDSEFVEEVGHVGGDLETLKSSMFSFVDGQQQPVQTMPGAPALATTFYLITTLRKLRQRHGALDAVIKAAVGPAVMDLSRFLQLFFVKVS
jgi:hypothetical protein